MFQFSDLGLFGAAIGAGIAALAAGIGISRIAAASVESMARQPEVKGPINGAMILTAALIEGVALFACVICLLISFSAVKEVKQEAKTSMIEQGVHSTIQDSAKVETTEHQLACKECTGEKTVPADDVAKDAQVEKCKECTRNR